MAEILPGSSTPQFGTAEYKSSSGPDRCKSCDTTLTSRYYRINGAPTCENCAERLKQQVPKDSHQAFVRGIVFGLGGAFLGLILYAISQIVKDKKAEKHTQVQHAFPQSSAPAQPQAPAVNGSTISQQPQTQTPAEPKKPSMGLGAALGLAVLIGLASPFLELQDPFHGIIGLIILFVGMRIAWRLTAGVKLDILGPFDKNAPAPAPPPIAG